ncbi:nicotinate-nucleotide adenylyltransferase [Desulfosarcina sp. OttesenSCG-928-A07]|nr:nicotinate-nucleotide adenylyltransferase [Desulfosarcina sp. OttesenSCG-928-G17]MDL2328303.1 nicotinate-nucleotide adenylyltransferase [Desulfosarcina sp. OttesenSCG-928-A07]
MRTGLFGGTFNPIHNGHLMAARVAMEKLCLDRLIFIPCYLPPHKPAPCLASAEDRLAMIRMAMHSDSRYRVSDAEIRRGGPSYTIDTIEAFSVKNPDDDIFLIMGMDAFFELHTWKDRRRIQEIAQVAVISRGVDRKEDKDVLQNRVEGYIQGRLSADYRPDGTGECCWHCITDTLKPVCLFLADPVDISSSQVRENLIAGLSVNPWVPAAVDAHIKKNGLYR